MDAPQWVASEIDAFGRSAGLRNLRLAENGVAALNFENGFRLSFAYAYETLTVMLTAPAPDDDATAAQILTAAHPDARRPFTLRAGYSGKRGEAVYAVRLPEREVSQVTLDAVFRELWQCGERLKG